MSNETEVKDDAIVQEAQRLASGGAVQNVPISQLYRQDNVRTDATLRLPEMILSIKRHGFKMNHPLVVSAKRNGRFLVLCGNRRSEAIDAIFANEPDAAAILFPTGTVPCIVHDGLTEEQEVLLRIDHSADEDRVALDEYGEFLAIRQLVRAGYNTQAGIAEKIGWFKLNKKTGEREPNRNKVQQRVNLAKLPGFVVDEYRKLMQDGHAATAVRWGSVSKLYTAYNEEYRQFPDGSGPVFQAAWMEAIKPVESDGTEKTKALTPAEITERSKYVGSASLRNAMLIVSGGGPDGVTLADVDGAIVQAEAAMATLSEIADYLGPKKFAELIEKSGKHANAKNAELAQSAA